MEPAHLTPPPSDDAWIDALLRNQEARSPLPDDGFQLRVLAALPPRHRRLSEWRRPVLCLVAALAGLVVAWHAGGGATGFSDASAQLTNGLVAALTPTGTGWPGLALATLIASALGYVFATEPEQSA